MCKIQNQSIPATGTSGPSYKNLHVIFTCLCRWVVSCACIIFDMYIYIYNIWLVLFQISIFKLAILIWIVSKYLRGHILCTPTPLYSYSPSSSSQQEIITSSVASPIPVRRGKVKETSWFLPFLPDFSSFFPFFFFPDFSLFFLIFGKFFTVRHGTLPPLPPQWLRHWL